MSAEEQGPIAPLGGLLHKALDPHRRAFAVSHRGALGISGSATVRGSRPSHLLSLHRAVGGENLLQKSKRPKLSEHSAYQPKGGDDATC